jgi:hypothetical protein
MHNSSLQSGSSNTMRMVEMRVSFMKSPSGSFPMESDSDLDNDNQQKTSKSHRFCIGKESSTYQELRELRLPSVHAIKRSAKMSMKKLRCQNRFRSGTNGIVTYDDYTADLYGCDVDDELPLLVGSDVDESTK